MSTLVPTTLAEALEARAAQPEAIPVAGGTDLMVEVNAGRCRPAALLDLSRIAELKTWERRNGAVRIGAGMTFARIASELGEFPPLVQAARTIGSPQIRNRATIGGNLGTASPPATRSRCSPPTAVTCSSHPCAVSDLCTGTSSCSRRSTPRSRRTS